MPTPLRARTARQTPSDEPIADAKKASQCFAMPSAGCNHSSQLVADKKATCEAGAQTFVLFVEL